MVQDKIRTQMAKELYEALVKAGKDPLHPPTDSQPPAATAWREYCKRGGENYHDPDVFIQDLITDVALVYGED